MGVEAYNSEQMQGLQILKILLEGYNDGRRKKVGKPYAERKVSLCGKAVPVISRAAGCGGEME